MSSQKIYLAATISINTVVCVNGKHLVGIDSDAEETRIGVDQKFGVSRFQDIQNRTFVKIGQVRHILTLNRLFYKRFSKFIKISVLIQNLSFKPDSIWEDWLPGPQLLWLCIQCHYRLELEWPCHPYSQTIDLNKNFKPCWILIEIKSHYHN